MPLISVIIPCYNVEKYIDRCLTSIVNQTIGISQLEIICVDDNSTDGTLDKLINWEKKYPENFIIIPLEVNSRQGAARNIGLEYASAEYVSFIDSDDWIELGYFEIMYKEIIENSLQVVTCQIQRDSSSELVYWNNKDDYGRQLFIVKGDNERKQLIMNPVFGGACCKLIKKSVLVDNGIIYPQGLCYEDLFWREILHLYVERGMVIDKKLYHYYVNTHSTTLGKDESYHMDYFTIVIQLWNYYELYGFLDKYREEIEYEYLIIAGLQITKVLMLRYSTSQYSAYRFLQNLIRQRIPDIRNCKYVNNKYFTEIQLLLIQSLYMDMSQEEYNDLANKIRVIGI